MLFQYNEDLVIVHVERTGAMAPKHHIMTILWCNLPRKIDCIVFSLPAPHIKPQHFKISIPESWFPVDRDHEYELVALDPDKLEYHLVASAFHETLPSTEANITDVFSVQNAYLWHKYVRSGSYSVIYLGSVWDQSNSLFVPHFLTFSFTYLPRTDSHAQKPIPGLLKLL